MYYSYKVVMFIYAINEQKIEKHFIKSSNNKTHLVEH